MISETFGFQDRMNMSVTLFVTESVCALWKKRALSSATCLGVWENVGTSRAEREKRTFQSNFTNFDYLYRHSVPEACPCKVRDVNLGSTHDSKTRHELNGLSSIDGDLSSSAAM